MVGVDEELGARVRARRREPRQSRDDARVLEEDGRDEHRAVRRRASAASRSASVSTGRAGSRTTSSLLLGEPPELAPQRVELAVGRDELRPLPQRQRREEPEHELVRVRGERDRRAGVPEQPPDSLAHALGHCERTLPLQVGVLGRVLPGLELRPRAPTSGQAWCECPVRSRRSETRNAE